MVFRTHGHEHHSSDQAAPSGASSVPPEPVCSPPPCLETERRQLSGFDLSPEVCDVILPARRPLTKTIYACRWDTFVAWGATEKVDPLSASLFEVVFALSLARQGLACGTVEGY